MYQSEEESITSSIFINKLWKMVNDTSTNHLIHWNSTGTSFVIPNQAQFWYEVLPRYYKHNNISSFVRQLNMYGFHKVLSLENCITVPEKDRIQFSHPYFVRNQPELLKNIMRNCSKIKLNENCKFTEVSNIFAEINQLKEHQVNVNSQLEAMKKENALLWREVEVLREKHTKQETVVHQLMEFLATVVRSRMKFDVKRGNKLKALRENSKKKSLNLEKCCHYELDFMKDVENQFNDVVDDFSVFNDPAETTVDVSFQDNFLHDDKNLFNDNMSKIRSDQNACTELEQFKNILNEDEDTTNVLMELLTNDQ